MGQHRQARGQAPYQLRTRQRKGLPRQAQSHLVAAGVIISQQEAGDRVHRQAHI